ncbi:hypothetical protein D3C80_1395390 [compost metagenome]
MPYSGNIDAAKVIACPGLANPQPAGIRFTVLTIAIPDKTDFDAPVFVGPDIFARWANNNRRLRTTGARSRNSLRMAIYFVGGLNSEIAMITEHPYTAGLLSFLNTKPTL